MTDVTELAQRMKSAALNATGAHERLRVMPEGDLFDISLAEGTQLDADITALNSFHDEATPANVLALVEALKAAERQNGYLKEQRDEWERKAISNFEDCSEMSKRIEELESQRQMAFMAGNRWADKFSEAEKRIEELEARTVKLPRRSVGEVMHMSGFSRDYAEGWCAGNDNAIHEIKQIGVAVEGDTNANNN